MRISDETLMAYVDGELDAVERAAVERAARTDAALARRIQAHRRLREQVGVVFADLVEASPPDRLLEAIRRPRSAQDAGAPLAGAMNTPPPEAQIVDLAKIRASRAAPKPAARSWMGWAAAAACLVIAVSVGLRLAPTAAFRPHPTDAGPLIGGAGGALIAQGGLAGALDGQLASEGARPGQIVRIGLTFHSADGHDCRTFQVQQGDGFAGLACHEAAGWKIRLAVSNSGATEGQGATYRTAASPMPAAILQAVDGMIAGAPFDARQEAEARARGWKS